MIEPRMYVKKCFSDLVVKYGSIFGKDKTMTDKQIDINNQVEVGLNIAKELLELHKMFEDEVEKSPHFIQTNFIKNKLFYFYQRADWLNVCFNLLDKQLKAKEQECEELKEQIKKHNDDMFKNPPEKRFYCKGCTLPYISKKLKQTLTEIKLLSENVYCLTNALNRDMALFAKEILQKISEVEDEHNG